MNRAGRPGRLIARAAGLALAALLVSAGALAGVMTRESLAQIFPSPLAVGERDARLPVWPVYRIDAAGKPALHAHVFESIDLEPVLGYAAKPINVLVAIDPAGTLLEARLVSHHEPLFRSDRGTATLAEFASQYAGLGAHHQVQVLSPKAQRSVDGERATLHGVLAGTVTTTAIDRSILESAMQVAQARLGEAGAGALTAPAARSVAGPDDRYRRMSFNELAQAGLLQAVLIPNAKVQERFKGTPVAGHDSVGILQPGVAAIDAWVAPVALPQAGRNLLDRAGWAQVRALREAGTPVLLVIDGGRYQINGDASGPAATANRSATIALRQDGRTIALGEIAHPHRLALGGWTHRAHHQRD